MTAKRKKTTAKKKVTKKKAVKKKVIKKQPAEQTSPSRVTISVSTKNRNLKAALTKDYSYINGDDPVKQSVEVHRELAKLRDFDDDDVMRKVTLEYAKYLNLNHKAVAKADKRKQTYPGRYAVLVMGGAQLPESYQQSLDQAMRELEQLGMKAKNTDSDSTEEQNTVPQPSIQDRIREQVYAVTCEFDQWLDRIADGKARKSAQPDPLALMQKADFKAAHAAQVRKIYQQDHQDLADAIAKKDSDLVEAYGCHSLRVLKAMHAWLGTVLDAASMISQAKKAVRRKRKPVSVEKQVSKLKYCETSTEYGLASVDPASIVGARELWVFNVRHRKLGRYIAAEVSGLGVKGTSIKDFHENNSMQVTLRKPQEQLPELIKAGKVRLRTFLDDIRGVKTKLNGRINENVVLVKVVK